MHLLYWFIIFLTSFIILMSVLSFVLGDVKYYRRMIHRRIFSREVFYTLLMVYIIVIIGFGLIYFLLSLNMLILVEDGNYHRTSILGSIVHSLYFSGVTLLTIGYGDIVPIGIGRVLALIQALIGYILPTASVLRLVQTRYMDGKEER